MPEDRRVDRGDVIPNPNIERDMGWIENRIINGLFPNPGDLRRAMIGLITWSEAKRFWDKLYGDDKNAG